MKITDVRCYYTGGGVYVYSARYGNLFLYGSLDNYICCYRERGEILFRDEDSCEYNGWLEQMNQFHLEGTEDDYYVSPAEIDYPTWQDILNSLIESDNAEIKLNGCIDSLKFYNETLSKLTIQD